MPMCTVGWGPHSGGYLLVYTAVWPVRRSMSSPSSESKTKPRKKPACELYLPPACMLLSFLVSSSTSETQANFQRTTGRYIQEDRISRCTSLLTCWPFSWYMLHAKTVLMHKPFQLLLFLTVTKLLQGPVRDLVNSTHPDCMKGYHSNYQLSAPRNLVNCNQWNLL
jgi:hypothetical protein